ncbi:MAG: hypothetical protein DBX97_02370 [Collinsella tanakaei]|nr:MAG: hypothetical protein DBX97_02370 [Collinsella tanakaei]
MKGLLLFFARNREKEGHSLPCPHHDIAIIKRSSRRSAVASAACQSGEQLFSEYDKKQKYYSLILLILVDDSSLFGNEKDDSFTGSIVIFGWKAFFNKIHCIKLR